MSILIDQHTKLPDDDFSYYKCSACENSTRHKILTKTDAHWQDDEGIVDLWAEYKVIQCQGCMTISFIEETQFSEDWDVDPDTGKTYIPTKKHHYPEHNDNRESLPETYLLPEKVRKIYEETHSSLGNKLNVMVGFGIRAIVEAVCNDKSITGRNLQNKIDNLVTAGHITLDGATILHSLRFMGNEAAHEIKEHKIEELNAAIDVIDYLLKGVYVLPKIAEKLPKKES